MLCFNKNVQTLLHDCVLSLSLFLFQYKIVVHASHVTEVTFSTLGTYTWRCAIDTQEARTVLCHVQTITSVINDASYVQNTTSVKSDGSDQDHNTISCKITPSTIVIMFKIGDI